MTHALKTWPEFFKEIASGRKKFEVRKYDRPFKVGEILLLQEFDNMQGKYTGEEIKVQIKYILEGGNFGIEPGYVCMSIEEIEY